MLPALLLMPVLAADGPAEIAPGTTRMEVAPGVFLPFVSDGIILDTPRNSSLHPEEEGLERFLSLGGRGVDTAWSYFNQHVVGAAVRNQKSAPRSDVFLTTKIECMGTAEAAYSAIQRDLKKLDLPYVDMVLIHAPYKGFGEPYSNCSKGPDGTAARQATWKGMEKAQKDGLTRAIGVSNFDSEYLAEIIGGAEIMPAVDQCCLSVGNKDDVTIAFAKQHGITYQAYSPLGGSDIGGTSILQYPQLKSIAANHPGKTTAQVALRWLVQSGHPFVTATGRADYITEDLSIFDWKLEDTEMFQLNAIVVPNATVLSHCQPSDP